MVVTDRLRKKLEDENITNTFSKCVQQVCRMKNKQKRKEKAYFLTVKLKLLSSFMDKFGKMRHIIRKKLQIMVLLKNYHLVEENKKVEYCWCVVF